MKCSAVKPDRRPCREEAIGLLVYDNHGTRYEHPLCEEHSDPEFHMRKLGHYWLWIPFGEAQG